MNYTLISTKQIGKYKQKTIIDYHNAPKSEGIYTLNLLKMWSTSLDGLNASTRELGERQYRGLNEIKSLDEFNNGLRGKADITVITENSDIPRTIQLSVENATLETIINQVSGAYFSITESSIGAENVYIVNVIINLIKGEQTND